MIDLRHGLLAAALLGPAPGCRQPNPAWQGPAPSSFGSGDGAMTESSGDETGDASSAGEGGCATPGPPGEGECPPQCIACDGGRCLLDCGATSCDAPDEQCPPGWPCDMQCLGSHSCRGAALTCPADHDCTVTCSSMGACRDAVVHCGPYPCTVSCTNDSNTCRGLEVECGEAETLVQCEGTTNVTVVPSETSSCACEPVGCG